ncbi:MAG: Potassium-transporting ATPase KdpC subunit [Elusimicrobia bacterium]|nr:Potassium-transporting ATPase KdpC subunit [Elusimicrobiota bacterium]
MYIEQLITAIRALIVLSVLTGIAYPFAMTGLAQVFFPQKANGSLVLKEGKAVGSELIGQFFDDPKYFWGRLSATGPVPFNGAASSGSNLGPINPALIKAAQDRISALKKVDPDNNELIPIDLVTASASGLDPHITPASARYQLKRIARVRGLSEPVVESLIQNNTEGRFLGLLGESRVNVLKLNLNLDEASHGSKTQP